MQCVGVGALREIMRVIVSRLGCLFVKVRCMQLTSAVGWCGHSLCSVWANRIDKDWRMGYGRHGMGFMGDRRCNFYWLWYGLTLSAGRAIGMSMSLFYV